MRGRQSSSPSSARRSPGGLQITEMEAVTAEGERVVFEFADEGQLRGKPYRNRVAIALEVCGEKICGYREYFGLVGPPPSGAEKSSGDEGDGS